MNLTQAASGSLVKALGDVLLAMDAVEVAVFPPFVYLSSAVEAAQGTPLLVGAQNIYHEPSGAFTGEVSADMVRDVGGRYVILGHSERRNLLSESNQEVNRKLIAALASELTPIVCVGELLAEREAGQTISVIQDQFEGSFAGLEPDQAARCVIAYEPVWAIGTGKVATPDQAEEVHANLRQIITGCFGKEIADLIRIQYGGSVKPANAADLLSQPNIDGALVGGASLNADDFIAIVHAADTCRAV